jgi:hypothetical protein
MPTKIERAAYDLINNYFHEHLKDLCKFRVRPRDGEIQVTGQVDEDSASQANFLRLCFNHAAKEVHLPTIYLPDVFRHQNLGKNLISHIFELAEASGYSFFIVQLVGSFYDRLVARGAEICILDDTVRITRSTNLSARPRESYRNIFGISLNSDCPIAEDHHWGSLPYPAEEIQGARIRLEVGDGAATYSGTLQIFPKENDDALFSTIVVLSDLRGGFGKDCAQMQIRLPQEFQSAIGKAPGEDDYSLSVPADVFKPYGAPVQFEAEA